MVQPTITADKLSVSKTCSPNLPTLKRCLRFPTLPTQHVHYRAPIFPLRVIPTVIMEVDTANSGVTRVYGR